MKRKLGTYLERKNELVIGYCFLANFQSRDFFFPITAQISDQLRYSMLWASSNLIKNTENPSPQIFPALIGAGKKH